MATTQTMVRDIALENPASIRVFEKFGIDYCCGGRKPLEQACAERALEAGTVLAAIEAAIAPSENSGPDWATASLESLCDHIVARHHAYIRSESPRLLQLSQRVVARHGQAHPELVQIQNLTVVLTQDLAQHLAKEETILFPYIANLERTSAGCGPAPLDCFGTVKNPIRMMMAEHDAAGGMVADIRALSHGYAAPVDACPTWLGFFQALEDFERDLHWHVHLENNILFPRAIELEERRG